MKKNFHFFYTFFYIFLRFLLHAVLRRYTCILHILQKVPKKVLNKTPGFRKNRSAKFAIFVHTPFFRCFSERTRVKQIIWWVKFGPKRKISGNLGDPFCQFFPFLGILTPRNEYFFTLCAHYFLPMYVKHLHVVYTLGDTPRAQRFHRVTPGVILQKLIFCKNFLLSFWFYGVFWIVILTKKRNF